MTDYAFIMGCARSGTSILGELVGSHPQVHYVFEASRVWERNVVGENDGHRLLAEQATPPVKKRIREWFENEAQGVSWLVEKNPRSILRVPYVRAVFPAARLIHIVRDGRDVACSMIPGCGGDTWSHLKPPSWKEYFDNYSGAVRCALVWKQSVEIGLHDLEGVSHLQVRYEDLLAAPVAIAANVFDYLGLKVTPEVTQFCQKISDRTDSTYQAKNQDRWYRGDHPVRMGRWHENLTAAEQAKIHPLLAPLLSRLGYSLD